MMVALFAALMAGFLIWGLLNAPPPNDNDDDRSGWL